MSKVAIVGRPNVGKSALFNRIIGKRIAIVDRQSGITRDRLGGKAEWNGRQFNIIDTGGIIVNAREPLVEQIHFQAKVAMEEADVILFVLDLIDGVTPLDDDVAVIIRKSRKPVITVVNKCDNGISDPRIAQFYALGLGDPSPVSAIHGIGVGDLLDRITEVLPSEIEAAEKTFAPRIAVVGKPNVGKSTFINCLLAENRLVVDNSPGTTRDAIDIEYADDKGQHFVLIDTAGIKRSRRIREAVDKYSFLRSQDAIERCDVALMMIDASEAASTGDAKIARMILTAWKSCVIVINKWDTVTDYKQKEYTEYIFRALPFMTFAPVIYTVASQGRNVHRSIDIAGRVYSESKETIPTATLNRLIESSVSSHQPPLVRNKRLKFYYATQIRTNPPHILLFVNDKSIMRDQYVSYLVNSIRKQYKFAGTPIRITCRNRK